MEMTPTRATDAICADPRGIVRTPDGERRLPIAAPSGVGSIAA